MRYSIRFFLISSLLLANTVILGVAMEWGYKETRQEVEELFDAELAQHSRVLQASLTVTPEDHGLPLIINVDRQSRSGQTGILGHSYESKIFFQVWHDTGKLLARSFVAPDRLVVELAPGYRNQDLDGHQWRLFILRDDEHGRWIVVGERDDVRGELITTIAMRSVLPVLISIPVVALLIWWVVGRGLAPLASIVDQLRRREVNDLDPIDLQRGPSELRFLVAAINDLFARLKQAIVKERQFTANAAHELRTPISAMMIHTQNALAEDGKQREQSLVKVYRGLKRTAHVVEQLLTLSRIDVEVFHQKLASVDLCRLLRDTLANDVHLAEDKNQSLALVAEGQAVIQGDATSLRILFRNLVDNALRYTQEGGHIEVRVLTEGQAVIVEVLDDGPGIEPDALERIFDRFYRVGGDAHGSGQSGAGLGLSIVKQIADLHGATVAVTNRHPRGLCFEVRFDRIEGERKPGLPGAM